MAVLIWKLGAFWGHCLQIDHQLMKTEAGRRAIVWCLEPPIAHLGTNSESGNLFPQPPSTNPAIADGFGYLFTQLTTHVIFYSSYEHSEIYFGKTGIIVRNKRPAM